MLNKEKLSEQIAYITINPSGKFVKSAQLGMRANGLRPKYIIHVSPKGRIRREFKRYRLGVFGRFILPKFRQHFGNTQSFSEQIVDIKIPYNVKVSTLNSSKTVAFIKENNIRYLVNCGAGIFRKEIIEIPGLKIINAHAGKLPEYRNMNVVEWAIYNNDPVVGTIHFIDRGIDTGNILLEREIEINKVNDIFDVREDAFDQVIRMAGEALILYEKGGIKPLRQPKEGKKWYKMHPYFLNCISREF